MADPYLPDELAPTTRADKFTHLIDPWSFLDYKPSFGGRGGTAWTAPTWVAGHSRRLQAYKIYEDYYRNAARRWLAGTGTPEDLANRREYGDAFVVVEQYLNSLMGDDQSIVVPEAIDTQEGSVQRKYLETLLAWAETEMMDLKTEECERNVMKQGDGVYLLGEDENGNPVVEVWDPGFYFPVLDPTLPSAQFPKKVHIAWEYERPDSSGKKRRYVRRKTYELIESVAGPEGEDNPAAVKYPWNDEATAWVCWFSEAEWLVADIDVAKSPAPDDLVWGKATTVISELTDTGYDFIPVVHIPNLHPSLAEHYGISILGNVMQVFDDIVNTDTDLQAASATTGSPPLVLSGSSVGRNEQGEVTTYGPGQVFEIGDGKGELLDTSRALDALLKLDDSLLERLSVNGRIPESMLGRVKPSEVPSGIALTISFGPHGGVINKMRKVRRRKYAILLKFVGRIMMKNGTVDQVFPAEYHFGSYLPSDRTETVNLVVQALSCKPPIISQATAIRMLIEAGIPIEDAQAELKRIQEEDFESANELLDATGDPALVARRLGVQATPQPGAAPPPTPPGPTP